jgi:hypothetical protein
MDQPTASIIDQPTATLIVGVIGAISSVAVALITRRSRIDMPQPMSINEATAGVHRRKSEFVRMFRVIGWAFVVLLYVISTIVFLILVWVIYLVYSIGATFNLEVLGYLLVVSLVGLLFLAVAHLGRKRLKRSHG